MDRHLAPRADGAVHGQVEVASMKADGVRTTERRRRPVLGVAVASSSEVVGRLKVEVRRGAMAFVARRPRVGVVCSLRIDLGLTKGRGFTHGDRTNEDGRRWTCGTSRASSPSSSLAFRSRTME